MSNGMRLLSACMAALVALCAPVARADAADDELYFGFGRQVISPEAGDAPLYIAGYNNGLDITDVLDPCEARAVWLQSGGCAVLLIGIDCVALDSGTISELREALSDLPNEPSINIYATHTHAGPDTLGLWGPVGVDGKNPTYMAALKQAAIDAARTAASELVPADVRFGSVTTHGMLRDSRDPQVYDPELYQLRLIPKESDGGAVLRMLFYTAHAESLRSANTLLSRDYPGRLCDQVSEATGDYTIFCPGAVGGLIMTREFVSDIAHNAVKNLEITADRLTDYALSIAPEDETPITPTLTVHTERFEVPLDNTAFLAYRALGILGHNAVKSDSSTGMSVQTELTVINLGELTLALIPGEIFPELVSGAAYGDANPDGVNPTPLIDIAAAHGRDRLLIIGLANDELGYIVPPSDFLVSESAPYFSRIQDYKGEDHYEETNSVGPETADAIARAFERAIEIISTKFN